MSTITAVSIGRMLYAKPIDPGRSACIASRRSLSIRFATDLTAQIYCTIITLSDTETVFDLIIALCTKVFVFTKLPEKTSSKHIPLIRIYFKVRSADYFMRGLLKAPYSSKIDIFNPRKV